MTSERIQELESRLADMMDRGGAEEIDALNALAAELIYVDSERAEQLAQRALSLSREGGTGKRSYQRGIGLSLANLGSVAMLRCDYQQALAHLMDAQSLLEAQQEQRKLCSVLRDLGWLFFNIGDFPQSIEVLLKGLRYARERGDEESEVKILNTLGAVYGGIGDKEGSIDAHRRALKYLDGTDDFRQKCLVYNNLAITYCEIEDYPEALKCADQSLQFARQLESPDLLTVAQDTIGQIYLAMREYAKAEDFFIRARSTYQGELIDLNELTLDQARAAFGLGRLDEAAQLLEQLLESVESHQVNRFSYQFHELLATIYEKQGDLPHAIDHFKRFHEIKYQVYNEETQSKLANLIVSQQAETNRIDAEIYRLKNLALRQEVSYHRQAVAAMEILATTDALTGLLNRRHFMTLGGYALKSAQQNRQSLSVLMMDIDDFKNVNDRYGHLVGDQVLVDVSVAIQASVRKEDLVCRYGGEEFAAVLPGSSNQPAQKVAERILQQVARCNVKSGEDQIKVTISIGMALASSSDENLENLLDRADQALYSAKRAGKNRVMFE